MITTIYEKPGRSSYRFKFKGRYSPIGIDLGSAMVKAIQFRQDRGKLSVHQMVLTQTPKGLLENGLVTSVDKLADLLSQLRLYNRWQNNLVNFCLNPQTYYLAKIRMPAMTKNELKPALQLEAENQFPLSPGEFVISFCPLYASDNKKENEYILVAAEKKASLAFSQAATLAGFKTAVIDIEPFALIRKPGSSIQAGQAVETECSLILNLGFQSSTVLITEGNYFSYCRSIRLGVEHFITALTEKEINDPKTASKLLFTREAIKDEAVKNRANQLVAKLKETLDYWQEQDSWQGHFPRSLNLCGGGTLIPGLPSVLSSGLGLKPALYNPTLLSNAVENMNSSKQTQNKALFATACGLALRGWVG
jgi:type IV pilus assembly protein PilM